MLGYLRWGSDSSVDTRPQLSPTGQPGPDKNVEEKHVRGIQVEFGFS